LKSSFATPALLPWILFALACSGDSASESKLAAISVESQDRIVSENGELELIEGTLAVRSIALVGADGNVPLFGPIVIDLAASEQRAPFIGPVPAGDYVGLAIELAPPDGGTQMLEIELRTLIGAEQVRAVSPLTLSGTTQFPEGTRTIPEGAELELHVNLTGMFFYLPPVSDAVDGRYEAGEDQRGFLTMNLVGMFDLHLSP